MISKCLNILALFWLILYRQHSSDSTQDMKMAAFHTRFFFLNHDMKYKNYIQFLGLIQVVLVQDKVIAPAAALSGDTLDW